ncbi:MAG: GNAT family N-acetyltransferase [Dehalococcoidia bacterium]
MHIRDANCTDVEGIARVHVASWQTSYRGIVPDTVLDTLSVERRQQMWTRWLCDEPGQVFISVAEADSGRIAGFASAGPPQRPDEIPDYDGELHTIYLLHEAQRQGIGRPLFAHTVERLAATGARAMLLWVLAGNHQARRFYERLGGSVIDSTPAQFGEAALEEVAYGWPDLRSLVASLKSG